MEDEERVDASKVVGYQSEPVTFEFNTRDILLYHLGIGFNVSEQGLPYLYEDHDDFRMFPTFLLVLPFKGESFDVVPFPPPTLASFPEEGLPVVNPAMILHASQSLTLFRPFPSSLTRLIGESTIVALEDKGKGALMTTETLFKDPSTGEVLASAEGGTFIRKLTGFQGASIPKHESRGNGRKKLPPLDTAQFEQAFEDQVDVVREEHVPLTQPALYRLSGDYNPLHIDPDMAMGVGFEAPILHGLCTLGFSARMVEDTFQEQQAEPCFLSNIECRFSSPFFPDNVLRVKMVFVSDREVWFKAFQVKEGRERLVLNFGRACFQQKATSRL